jgi:hypothetical protein
VEREVTFVSIGILAFNVRKQLLDLMGITKQSQLVRAVRHSYFSKYILVVENYSTITGFTGFTGFTGAIMVCWTYGLDGD